MQNIIVLLSLCVALFINDSSNFRLSTEAVPNHYSIKIKPDLDNEIFYGEVRINLHTKSTLNKIILHLKDLNVSEVYLNQRHAIFNEVKGEKISVGYENETIEPGEHIMFFKYSGALKEAKTGFIKALFESNGNKTYIYITDLEPTSARKVFPCFDEPVFKAKFSVRLITPNNTYKAVSNMPIIKSFTTSQGIVNVFATSIRMSTYLVSFALTPFPYYEDVLEENGRNITIRVHTLGANKENNAYAIECTKKAISFYTKYTNISYPLSKLDMIEYIRSETAATENWGLITFREGLLSLNLNIFNKDQIAVVIYHEISHFWFGNLVTIDWWNDLWLQEGFASYMSYKLSAEESGVSQIEEMKSFQFDQHFENEINKPSHSIVSYLKKHEDIFKKFESLVYDKGAGILLMLEDVIGEQTFQNVIRTYLNKYAYVTVTTNDFISVVEDVVPDMNLRPFIESFIFQNKFPIIYVEEGNGTFLLTQQIYSSTANELSTNFRKHRWTIPITYITNNNDTERFIWFDEDMDTLKIEEPGAKFIVLNIKGKGMYKTNFSNHLWMMLIQNFEFMDVKTSDMVISDAFYSFRFNLISCDILINFMKYTRSVKKWTSFGLFYEHLTDNLYCNKKQAELKLFWNFIIGKFNETGYKRRRSILKTEVNCNDNNGFLVADKASINNVEQCATWIRNNLSTHLD